MSGCTSRLGRIPLIVCSNGQLSGGDRVLFTIACTYGGTELLDLVCVCLGASSALPAGLCITYARGRRELRGYAQRKACTRIRYGGCGLPRHKSTGQTAAGRDFDGILGKSPTEPYTVEVVGRYVLPFQLWRSFRCFFLNLIDAALRDSLTRKGCFFRERYPATAWG